MDLRQTREYGNFLEQIGWIRTVKNNRQYFIKKIPLFGCAIKLQRPKDFNLKDIESFEHKFRIFEIILEPENLSEKQSAILQAKGYKLSSSPYLPTKTLQIDISTSIDQVYSQMKKDARYSIRKSDMIEVFESQDIVGFRKAWKAAVGYKRHVLPLNELEAFKTAFRKNMTIVMNKNETSGALFLLADNICYYWVGFTDDFARKSLVQYQVLWRGIQWAKKRKAKVFDFEGIYDERFPKAEWKGFSHFKKSFGGKEVVYPGCFIKWRFPILKQK